MKRRLSGSMLTVAIALGGFVWGVPAPVAADSTTIDFEAFTLGNPDSQDGWQFTGAYDVEVVDPSLFGAPAGFGDTALRISNAVTSGSFGDWAFSKSLADEAGETSAVSDGFSGGTRQSRFEASFDIVSAVPAAEQSGLQFSLAPDRGDGARMSFLRFNDTSGGIDVTFADYVDKVPTGGCLGDDDFRSVVIASGLDRSVAHNVQIEMEFLDGRSNDRVFVRIDGSLKAIGTSWEDYYRDCEGNPTRPVDSLIFQARSGAGTAPATDGFGFLVDNINLKSEAIPDTTTAGTWTLDPPQTVTETKTTEDLYNTKVRPPINVDGSSNWPKKKGVIPVQFDLETATATTTETTTNPAVLESILSDNESGQNVFTTFGSQSNDFGVLRFTPSGLMNFGELQELIADYLVLHGNCSGGSLRWSVRIDVGSNGDASDDGSLAIYYGLLPNNDDCDAANSQSGANMIGMSDLRYDATQLGGDYYGTYANALGVVGTQPVVRATLVADGGWVNCPGFLPGPACLDQRFGIAGATANNTDYTPLPSGTTTSTTTTPFAKTCVLPDAELRWAKSDSVPTGPINEEAESIQLKDTGHYYRKVDCKYIYNLDVSSLGELATRQGTYWVYAKIDGVLVTSSPAQFDLK